MEDIKDCPMFLECWHGDLLIPLIDVESIGKHIEKPYIIIHLKYSLRWYEIDYKDVEERDAKFVEYTKAWNKFLCFRLIHGKN